MDIQTSINTIRNLQSSSNVANVAFVKQAIEIGNHLINIKEKLGHTGVLRFAKDNFGISLRSCQDYMKIGREVIHENHYKLGLHDLLEEIKKGTDLAYPTLDRFCQACPFYNGCILSKKNQKGTCPCTRCDIRHYCREMCDEAYIWEESF